MKDLWKNEWKKWMKASTAYEKLNEMISIIKPSASLSKWNLKFIADIFTGIALENAHHTS